MSKTVRVLMIIPTVSDYNVLSIADFDEKAFHQIMKFMECRNDYYGRILQHDCEMCDNRYKYMCDLFQIIETVKTPYDDHLDREICHRVLTDIEKHMNQCSD